MKKRIIDTCLIIFIFIINIYLIKQSFEFSKIYPFDRIMIGNVLYYSITPGPQQIDFNSEIVEIDGQKACGKNVIALLVSGASKKSLDVSFKSGDVLSRKNIAKEEINKSILWFFIFMVFLSDILFLWGMAVRWIHPDRHMAKVFVCFALAVCVYIFFVIEYFSFRRFIPLYAFSTIALGYFGIYGGYNLTNKKMTVPARVVLLIPGAVLMGISFFFPSVSNSAVFYKINFLFLVLCCIYVLARFIIKYLSGQHDYLFRRNFAITVSVFLAALVPCALYLISLYVDLKYSVYIAASLILFLPYNLGSRLLENNFFNIRMDYVRGFTNILINLIISVFSAAALYYIIISQEATLFKVFYYAVFGIMISCLLYLKHILSNKMNRAVFQERDHFTNSLQHIAELVSSPAELGLKLENIYSEVTRFCGILSLKLLLFDEMARDLLPGLSAFLEYEPIGSSIHGFLKKTRNIVLRYTLISNDPAETEVYEYMLERNVVVIVPLFSGKEIIGAALVGEKRREDFFSDEEIDYFQTVSEQLYYLLKNDRLFNDYLAKRGFEKELDIASTIQLRLLPKKAPERRGMHISFYNRPFIKVTGDYFDFINIDKNRTAVIIGDVSGHGLSASMILSMTSSIMNAMLMEKLSIERAVEEINHFLNYRYNGVDLITMFAGVYNQASRELVYVNAGHCTPLLIKSGKKEITSLEGRSKILGADPAASYFSSRCTLSKNDEIILYTDGLVEIFNENMDVQFNESVLLDILYQYRNKNVDHKLKAVIDIINEFKNGAIRDDITIIGIQIL